MDKNKIEQAAEKYTLYFCWNHRGEDIEWDCEINEAFLAGNKEQQKQTEKVLRDLKNKWASWLAEEQLPKLGKEVNLEEIIELRIKLQVLKEIKKKLGI